MLDKPRMDNPVTRAPTGGAGGKPGPTKSLKLSPVGGFGPGRRAEGAGFRRATRPINLERRACFARFDA